MKVTSLAMLLCCIGILACSVHAQDIHVQVSPEFKFAADDAYRFPTIQNALDHAPDVSPGGRLYIHIAPGTYRERLYVSQYRPRTTLLGMGTDPSQVVVSAGQNPKSAQSTFFSETVEVLADDFHADNLTIENTAGATGQAVALSVTADRVIVKHCRLLGYQDTLFANYGRQYYVDSYIAGAVDFIFGNAAAVFERSEIHATNGGYLTAQSRTSEQQKTGYVILHSRITNDDLAGKGLFLGRPWRAYSRVIVMNSELSAGLDPKGWNDWGRDPKTVFYAEFENTGAGAAMDGRLPWVKHLSAVQAQEFLPAVFLAGEDHWDAAASAAHLP